jgi:hypothetical protein
VTVSEAVLLARARAPWQLQAEKFQAGPVTTLEIL